MDGDLRGPQVRCAGAHESNDSRIKDGLLKLKDFPIAIGGSGEEVAE